MQKAGNTSSGGWQGVVLWLFALPWLLQGASLAETHDHCLQGGPLESDSQRLAAFVESFTKSTFRFSEGRRNDALDDRIAAASLGLGDKAAAVEVLSPRAEEGRLRAVTGPRIERRLERLLLSISTSDLARFKFELEYDGDYKDLEEILFHDLDNDDRRARLLAHFRRAPASGVKVLTDVDDTLYANLVDKRYPKGSRYPGVVAFYAALASEPFPLARIPVTTLSARPNPIGGALEEASLEKLTRFTAGRLCPSGLSGSLVSSVLGTAETLGRANLDLLSDLVPDGKEREIGEVKHANFARYARAYPDYRFVFVGDSGQADAWTARLMLDDFDLQSSRVATTFIHDLRTPGDETAGASLSFKELPPKLRISAASANGRGVIVFRNYIEAAALAYRHTASLGTLIDGGELASVTRSALEEFGELEFESSAKRTLLRNQHWTAAKDALALLVTSGDPAAKASDLEAIRRLLADESS